MFASSSVLITNLAPLQALPLEDEQPLLQALPPFIMPERQPSSMAPQEAVKGFMLNAIISSNLFTSKGIWFAEGNVTMTDDNGYMTDLNVDTTWHLSDGTTSHIHKVGRPETVQRIVVQPDKSAVINARADVSTCMLGHPCVTSWPNIRVGIHINRGETFILSVNDTGPNSAVAHFNGQPLRGIIKSYTECSDRPLPDMEVIPGCQVREVPQVK